MSGAASPDNYGKFTEPTTLVFQRLLPGPVERVWDYLTQSDLRRQWLAAGEMEQKAGASFTLVWQNDTLTNPPGTRPEGFGETHSMESRITLCVPPHSLTFTWGEGDVAIELAARGEKVLLTMTHRRIAEHSARLMIGAGWHAHLDILAARLLGKTPVVPFWDGWLQLRSEYADRIPG